MMIVIHSHPFFLRALLVERFGFVREKRALTSPRYQRALDYVAAHNGAEDGTQKGGICKDGEHQCSLAGRPDIRQ